MPLIVKDLFRSTAFLRWQEAIEIGINRGLGIPYTHASGNTWVMSLLSARDTPIARRFEIWVPNESTDALIFDSGDCDQSRIIGDRLSIGQDQQGPGDDWPSLAKRGSCRNHQHSGRRVACGTLGSRRRT